MPNPSNTVEITELPDVEKPSSRVESKSEDVGERKERLTDETNEDRGEVAGETVKQDLSSTTLQQKRYMRMSLYFLSFFVQPKIKFEFTQSFPLWSII